MSNLTQVTWHRRFSLNQINGPGVGDFNEMLNCRQIDTHSAAEGARDSVAINPRIPPDEKPKLFLEIPKKCEGNELWTTTSNRRCSILTQNRAARSVNIKISCLKKTCKLIVEPRLGSTLKGITPGKRDMLLVAGFRFVCQLYKRGNRENYRAKRNGDKSSVKLSDVMHLHLSLVHRSKSKSARGC